MNADGLIEALDARRGHFRLESGHHGELWLDLDGLFARPARLAPFVAELAERLSACGADVVCGPLVGGAFVAHAVAERLGIEAAWSERVAAPSGVGLYAARYRIPDALRDRLRGSPWPSSTTSSTPGRRRGRRSPTCAPATRAPSRSAPCSSSATGRRGLRTRRAWRWRASGRSRTPSGRRPTARCARRAWRWRSSADRASARGSGWSWPGPVRPAASRSASIVDRGRPTTLVMLHP